MRYYLKAKSIFDGSKEYKMLGLISDEIGTLNWNQDIVDEVLSNYLEALKYYGLAKDTLSMSYALRSIGRYYLSVHADFEMEMYNADGTRAEMCGNGIRCVAKYAHDKGLTDRARFSIISGGKVKYMDLTVENGVTKAIRVDMGEPILTAAEVPVVSKNRQSIDEEITVENQTYRMTCVSMGNPHAVVFVDSTADLPLEQIGPHFEHHERFPRRTNTEFVEIVSPEYVKMRVWERGTGETLACGTGCCATAVACVLNGKTGRKVTVEVLGGALTIQWDEKTNHIFMTGPAEFVFDGELEYEV